MMKKFNQNNVSFPVKLKQKRINLIFILLFSVLSINLILAQGAPIEGIGIINGGEVYNLENTTINQLNQTVQQNCSIQYFKETKFLSIPFAHLYKCIIGQPISKLGRLIWPASTAAGVFVLLILMSLLVYFIRGFVINKKEKKNRNI